MKYKKIKQNQKKLKQIFSLLVANYTGSLFKFYKQLILTYNESA